MGSIKGGQSRGGQSIKVNQGQSGGVNHWGSVKGTLHSRRLIDPFTKSHTGIMIGSRAFIISVSTAVVAGGLLYAAALARWPRASQRVPRVHRLVVASPAPAPTGPEVPTWRQCVADAIWHYSRLEQALKSRQTLRARLGSGEWNTTNALWAAQEQRLISAKSPEIKELVAARNLIVHSLFALSRVQIEENAQIVSHAANKAAKDLSSSNSGRFGLRAGDWQCPSCKTWTFCNNSSCCKCKRPRRPQGQ
jgi:hypothetical protein